MLTASPLYAGLSALLLLYLGLRVVQGRRRYLVSVGDGGEKDLMKRMRVQANCAEYAPIGVVLLVLAELQGMPVWLVHLFGLTLTGGRVLHAWGMSSTPQVVKARQWGMYLTLFMIGSLALGLIGHWLI